MAFTPGEITRQHVLQAVRKINDEGIELIPSTRWNLEIEGQKYPPKEIMRYAHAELNGEKIWERTGGEPTNKYLRDLGFTISEKRTNVKNIEEMINRYKEIIEKTKLKDEIYKWELLTKYRGRPNTAAENFYDELRAIDYSNLVYPLSKGVLKEIAASNPEGLRLYFKNLFDENIPLKDRIEVFTKGISKDFKVLKNNNKLSGYQGEREVSTYLTFYNPDIYTLYKSYIYKKFCQLLNIEPKPAGEKYEHHLELINNFVDEYLKDNTELVNLVNSYLPNGTFEDTSHKLLAQDILYQVLEKNNDEEKIEEFNNTIKPYLENYNMKQPLNQILYGPPGTGKTFHTINKALEIIGEEIDYNNRELAKEKFNAKVKEGQIVFTTFHQSMSYEDFIEGIKPLKPITSDAFVKYDIQPGIFYSICEKAKSNYQNSKAENKEKLSFEEAFEKFKDAWENEPDMKFPLKTEGYEFTITGFTNTSIQFKKASGGTAHTLSIKTLKELYYGKEYNFNQGIGIYYPAVLNKIQSFKGENRTVVLLNNYVLIIDEINRGNISQIFGELITLIEEDKRLGKTEALEITLPYSKELFGVPPNLYIIGTMNTADRSVEALDTALRRRFSFEEMPPKYDLEETKNMIDGYAVKDILKTINNRIEKLLDKDHLIGHSYFMNIKTTKELETVFRNKVIPLLQEYFYGDYGKIGLVLGNGFVRKIEWNSDNLFADFDYENKSDFDDREVFELHCSDFKEALKLLMEKNQI